MRISHPLMNFWFSFCSDTFSVWHHCVPITTLAKVPANWQRSHLSRLKYISIQTRCMPYMLVKAQRWSQSKSEQLVENVRIVNPDIDRKSTRSLRQRGPSYESAT